MGNWDRKIGPYLSRTLGGYYVNGFVALR